MDIYLQITKFADKISNLTLGTILFEDQSNMMAEHLWNWNSVLWEKHDVI